jgi:acetyl-CoA carboxylase carboxyltransferase component
VEEETKKVKEQNEKNEKIEKEYQLKIQQLYDDRNKLNDDIIRLREERKNLRKKN